ncbi:integral membrane protein [Aspergillus fumigatus Z5]|nr:integral membrane protein [Aspergillus fumigatus Z5]
MRLPPPQVLLTWPTPNYVDPLTRGNGALIVNIVCLSFAFVVTLLRLYTRLKITYSPGLDDALIVIALGFAIAMCAVTSLATVQYGWNRHMWDVPPMWLSTVSKLNLVFQILFSLASSVTKLSLLWFCKRLLGAGSKGLYRTYNWCLIGGMAFVSLTCALFLLFSIFQCNPIHAYWDLAPTYPYKCLNDGAIVFSASVINIFTDFLVTVLPMPLIWNLKLPTRQRIAVISIFSLGIVVNVAGSVRTVYVWKSMIASYDTTWLGWPVLLAASVEINMGLTSRNYTSGTGRKSNKLFSSAGPSKGSRLESRQHGIEGLSIVEPFEVMRTVEMETWTEPRVSHQSATGNDLSSSRTRVATPTTHFDLKNETTVYTSPGSHRSSASLSRDKPGSPFGDEHLI